MEVKVTQSAAIPRNEPCPCGTGLKHKSCCGWLDPGLPDQETVGHFEGAYGMIQQAAQAGRAADTERMCLELLNQAPGHVRTLRTLLQVFKATGRVGLAEILARRVLKLLPRDAQSCGDLGLLLYERGNLQEAEQHARNMVRLEPDSAQGHNLMGMVLTDMHKLPSGEFHYRRALKLHRPVGKLCANLGANLRGQGKLEEAEEMYRQAMQLEPENMVSLMGWVQVKEAARKFDEAWKLYDDVAKRVPPGNVNLCMTRATLHRRQKELDKALQALDESDPAQNKWTSAFHYERGRILDALGRWDEAFESYSTANRVIVERSGRVYGEAMATQLANRLKAFFVRDRMRRLPRGIRGRFERATPIFIVGFPRSGTTMVEQILTTHERIVAGDELPYMWEMTAAAPRILNSTLFYPECLIDLVFGDNQAALETLRESYLKKVYRLGILERNTGFFTDKMPLNETNLGLIHLVFPEAPVVHLVRHPLDVVLSSFFTDFTHGNNCSYTLESVAKHFVLIRDLVDHYLAEMDVNYLALRYEDIVADPEKQCRKLLNFAGVEWDPRCLEFHQNPRYARTASYAQVTEALYSRSVHRYRNYLRHLEPVIPILEPVIRRLGYTIERA